jgi:hypothetical protein
MVKVVNYLDIRVLNILGKHHLKLKYADLL